MRKRLASKMIAIGVVCAAMVAALQCRAARAASDEAVLQADHALVEAVGKTDNAALGRLLDESFVWTDSAGKTSTKAQVLENLPKPADGYDAEAKVRTYGDVAAVQSANGKVHVLRIWVQRSGSWRMLVYQEVTQAEKAEPPGPGTNICVNPCKTVPYTPKNEAEKGVIISWQQLETAVTNHEPQKWATHFGDDFVLIASGATQPTTKADRITQLSKPGIGPAPPALAWAHMFDYGNAIVMEAQSKPFSGKPAHISRVWFQQNDVWQMALSYQTTIQAAPAIVPK